jgi:hypothetical protein
MLGPENSCVHRHQRGELVSSARRILCLSYPESQIGAGEEGIGVLGPQARLPGLEDLLDQIAGGGMATVVPQVLGQGEHAAAGGVKHGLGVRQQGRERRPGIRILRFRGERGLDHRGGGAPPGDPVLLRQQVKRDCLNQPVY